MFQRKVKHNQQDSKEKEKVEKNQTNNHYQTL